MPLFLATAQLPLGDRKDLGAVLHQALHTGIPRLRDRNPSYPAGLTELVDSLCARDPADRPTSAAEVATRLGALADGTDSIAHQAAVDRRLAGLLQESGNHIQACEVLGRALDISEGQTRGR
ncbi:hypothetical protein AB0O22_21670 [Streptomyces sp. NPDC091204]|uniref:hypothetical protein n=1 Tax=Streptomyces sp. NPDC091204 TaxID=3155299 RepID=UPI00342FDA1A